MDASMDASPDVWDWEVLPDHRTFSAGHGAENSDGGQETMETLAIAMAPPGDAGVHDPAGDECKDIGVVPDEARPAPSADDLTAPDGSDEEEKLFKAPDAKDGDLAAVQLAEEDDLKKDGEARPECVVFSVGKLKVNGIGALCSFGVAAAATICIFLIGGKLQHHHRQQQQQQQKIQLQFYGDDKRIQQVVQQTSRLNQAMSSVMGAGASTRGANISFGGFYDGF